MADARGQVVCVTGYHLLGLGFALLVLCVGNVVFLTCISVRRTRLQTFTICFRHTKASKLTLKFIC